MLTTRQIIENAIKLNFSDEQWEVVTTVGKPTSIVSCAGSGKTTVLVARLLYLELEHNIKPYSVLAMTFSKDAATEMETRYKKVRGNIPELRNYSPKFTTFHAFYFSVLRNLPQYKNVSVVDQGKYTARIANSTDIPKKDEFGKSPHDIVNDILNYRSFCINNGKDPYNILGKKSKQLVAGQSPELVISVMRKYEQLKSMESEIDFDDMQVIIYKEIVEKENPVLLEAFRNTYSTVLVDEYQDISGIQNDILNRYMREVGFNNLTVIGDDDQCIYEFRGSNPSIIRDFPYTIPHAQPKYLSTNYRCPKEILQYIAPVIAKNNMRMDKKLSSSTSGGTVEYYSTIDQKELIEAITKDYKEFGDVAVLTRTNAKRTVLVDRLVRSGMEVAGRGVTGKTLYDMWYYTKMLNVFNAIINDDSYLAMSEQTILFKFMPYNIKQQYIKKSSTKWVDDALSEKTKLGEYVTKATRRSISNILADSKNAETVIKNLIIIMRPLAEWLKKQNQIVTNVGSQNPAVHELDIFFGYMAELSKGKTMKEFIQDNKDTRLKLIAMAETPEGIKFYTMHGVKGLEFKSVYIYDADDKEMANVLSQELNKVSHYTGRDYNEHIDKWFNFKTQPDEKTDKNSSLNQCARDIVMLEYRTSEILGMTPDYNPYKSYYSKVMEHVNELESERRLFYVACTRAKRKLSIVVNPASRNSFVRQCIQLTDTVEVPLINVKAFVPHEDTGEQPEKEVAPTKAIVNKGKSVDLSDISDILGIEPQQKQEEELNFASLFQQEPQENDIDKGNISLSDLIDLL